MNAHSVVFISMMGASRPSTQCHEHSGPVGSKEWLAAREIVMSYVRARRLAKQCILDLHWIRLNTPETAKDLAAVTWYERVLFAYVA